MDSEEWSSVIQKFVTRYGSSVVNQLSSGIKTGEENLGDSFIIYIRYRHCLPGTSTVNENEEFVEPLAEHERIVDIGRNLLSPYLKNTKLKRKIPYQRELLNVANKDGCYG